jgi:hypothetical protein
LIGLSYFESVFSGSNLELIVIGFEIKQENTDKLRPYYIIIYGLEKIAHKLSVVRFLIQKYAASVEQETSPDV